MKTKQDENNFWHPLCKKASTTRAEARPDAGAQHVELQFH
jgi:hypothetical protein